jgi:pimeloyl-ACP methyl ester carboxylesterase
MSQGPRVVFLHGWCGHGDEATHLKPALPGPLLAPSWMLAPGSIDLEAWPQEQGPAMDAAMAQVANQIHQHVRHAILQAGFAGSLLIGHSMGGALACLLASDPAIAARGLVLLDSSVPMPSQRRVEALQRMGSWVARAAREGRLPAQAAWILDQPNRTDHFFHPSEQGAARALIERRMAHSPVVEAAATLGGYVQWPTAAALEQLRCPLLALAGDPGRLPVAALRQARPDAVIQIIPNSGHFLHVSADREVQDLIKAFSLDLAGADGCR